MRRPNVSVVVPFAGSDEELHAVRRLMGAIKLADGDELIIADNRLDPIRTPACARNRGADRARGEWLLFLDADVEPRPELLDVYFDPPPAQQTGILAGEIVDAAPDGGGLVARYSVARGQLSQTRTLERAGTPYTQTANCAIRRSAFTSVGGFEETARAGEDADLCFRLYGAGWALERRPRAAVSHLTRARLHEWMTQLVVHGSGAAWLERRWCGEFSAASPRALAARLGHHLLDAVKALASQHRETAAFALLDLLGACAFELGRLVPNTRSGRCRFGRRREGHDARMRR